MAHKRIFRFTLAVLLVVVAAGAAWFAGNRTGSLNGGKLGAASLQPAAVETQSILPQGKLAWDCPGCPTH